MKRSALVIGVLAFVGKVILVVGAVTFFISVLYAKKAGVVNEADMAAATERFGNTAGIVAGVLAGFAGAWWMARKEIERAVLNGIMVGVVMSALELALDLMRGRISPASLISIFVNLLGALAGVALARLVPRRPADSAGV